MMLRGILLGIGLSAVSVFLFFRWSLAPFRRNGPISIDPRYFQSVAAPFFSGFGLGFFVVLGLVYGAIYAFWRYGQHIALHAQR
jgi:hypothetical protein